MRTLIRNRTKSMTAGVVAGAMLAVGLAGTANANNELVLDHGHIDAFTVTWANDDLAMKLREDVTGSHVIHAPEDVLLKVKEDAKITLPTPVPSSLSFLGEGGDEVYYLPQTQDQNLIWPGWSTELVPTNIFTNPLQIQISNVSGPGDVFLWQTGSFGGSQSVLAGGGYKLPGTINANANVHVHSNWAFTEPGKYDLTVRAVGNRVGGDGTETSAPVTYTFQVSDPAAPSTSLSISGIEEHYHSGETVSLSAVQEPATDLDHYHWFTKAPGATEFTVVNGAESANYSFAASEALNGTQVIAKLYDSNEAVVAESSAVVVNVEDHEEEENPETELSISGLKSQYTVGENVALNAVQTPQTSLDHYHWFTQAKGSTTWTIVPGVSGGSYGFAATAAHDGTKVVAKLYNDHHEVVAESSPVTLTVKAAAPPAAANPIQALLTSVGTLLTAVLGIFKVK